MWVRGHRTGSRKEHPEAPVEAQGQVRGESERQGGSWLPEVEAQAREAEHSWAAQREPLRAEMGGCGSSAVCHLQPKTDIKSADEGGAGEMGALVTVMGESLAAPQGVRQSDRRTSNSTPRCKPERGENIRPHKSLDMA